MNEHVTAITDATFEEEVLKSETPVLVDYWSEYCSPCKAMLPAITALAEEYAGKVKVVKINIDENPNTAPRFGVRSLPTLMLFKNGAVEDTKLGALSKNQLTAFLEENA